MNTNNRLFPVTFIWLVFIFPVLGYFSISQTVEWRNNNDLREVELSDLRQRIKDHEDWLQNTNMGHRLTLSNLNLSGVKISSHNLSKSQMIDVDFQNAELTEVGFVGSQLTNVHFQQTMLTEIGFVNALLTNVYFNHSELVGVGFRNAELANVHFESTFLTYLHFDQSKLDNVNFDYAKIIESDFSLAELTDVDFKRTELSEVDFIRTDFKNVNLPNSELTNINLKHAELASVSLYKAVLTNVDFRDATLKQTGFQANSQSGVLFNNAGLANVSFNNARLTNVNFAGANLAHTGFDSSELIDVDFEYSKLKDGGFNRAGLTEVWFNDANLSNIDFQSSGLTNVVFVGAELNTVPFGRAGLTNVVFGNAGLREVFFHDAELMGVNFQKAKMANVPFRQARMNHVHFLDAGLTNVVFTGTTNFAVRFNFDRIYKSSFENAIFLDQCTFESSEIVKTSFEKTDLQHVVWSAFVTDNETMSTFSTTTNLHLLSFGDSESGLISLRNGFKNLGMKNQLRDINYAINHQRRINFSDSEWFSRIFYGLVELTTEFGRASLRPLKWMFYLSLGMSIPYTVAVWRTKKGSNSGVWILKSAESVSTNNRYLTHTPQPVLDKPMSKLRKFLISLVHGLLFSFTSTFRIGWKDISIGNWISRMDPRGVIITPSGWIQTLSGIQSVLGVILFALFLISYFGVPLE